VAIEKCVAHERIDVVLNLAQAAGLGDRLQQRDMFGQDLEPPVELVETLGEPHRVLVVMAHDPLLALFESSSCWRRRRRATRRRGDRASAALAH
jgi:hypothetical protein